MTLKTTWANVRAIAVGEPGIAALHESDPLVTLALQDAARMAPEEVFGTYAEMAQRYLAAHIISQALQDDAGRGALSNETIGGVTRSWTMPNLNMKSAIGATQYGLKFLEIRDMRIPKVAIVPPSC